MILLKATNEVLQVTNSSALAIPKMKSYAIGITGTSGGSTTVLTVSPDSTISNGDWMILVVASLTSNTITTPTGWTVLQPATTAGTLITAIYAKPYVTGETVYTVTMAANANTSSLYLMWGSGGDVISNWVIGANTLRANITPTTTYNNVAASITTTTPNNLVLAISTERTTATESSIVSITGATHYAYVGQNANNTMIETTEVGYINQTSAGATPAVTVVYQNTQSANGQAIQIGIPPAISNIDFSVSYTDDTSTTSVMSSNEGKITSLTTTTLASAPASAGTERVIKLMAISNIDPYVGATVVVQKNIAGTTYNLSSTVQLSAGETLQYMDRVGWTVYGASGLVKSDFTTTYSAQNQVLANNVGLIAGASGLQWGITNTYSMNPQAWYPLATSADGQYLATTDSNYGFMYFSKDGGKNWIQNSTPNLQQNWYGIFASADGSKYIVSSGGQNVYLSYDYGASFSLASLPAYYYYGTGASANFQKLYAAANGQYVYVSLNSGKTWSQTGSPSADWATIIVSGDGSKVYALTFAGAVYASTNNGSSWTNTVSLTSGGAFSGYCSYDGTIVYLAASNGYVYVSSNSGQSFTQVTALGSQTYVQNWCSYDGTKAAVAVANGNIYTTTDTGKTWTNQTSLPTANYVGVTMTADGTKMAATVSSGPIYTFESYGNFTWNQNTSTLSLPTNGLLSLGTSTTDPAGTPTNGLSVYSRNFAGRNIPTFKGTGGEVVSLQHAIWQNASISEWLPGPTNIGTWIGTSTGVTVGTAASVMPTTTNVYTTMRRSTFSNVVTTTNQQMGVRTSDNMYFVGSNQSQGGMYFVCRFGFDAIATGCRAFVGFAQNTSTNLVSVEVSTNTNMFGFGFDSTDTAWTFMHNGASGTANKEVGTGQGTLATANTGYDAYIWMLPNSQIVNYRLERTDTGAAILNGSTALNLPLNSVTLQAVAQMSNGTANTAVNTAVIGINRLYVETNR